MSLRPSLRTRALLVAIIVASAGFPDFLQPPVADAQAKPAIKPEADVRFKRGLEHFRVREYEAAITEFEAAYAIDPRPEVLFSMAQAERLSGDCATAVVLYRKFLGTDPPAVHAEAAHASLDKCEVALRSRSGVAAGDTPPAGPGDDKKPGGPTAPDPATTAAQAERSSSTALPADRPARRAAWKDPLGASLGVAGVAALGAGVYYFAASTSDASAAADAARWSEHDALLDRAESRRTRAWILAGAGSALLAGATWRWMSVGGATTEARPSPPAGGQLGAAVQPGGVTMTWGGRF